MANLMARNGHLVADGGHLVAATADCVQKCCGCLACTTSGRVGTVTISGLASVTGTEPLYANDTCGECPGLNGSYGGDFGTSTAPAPNTFLCGCYGPNNATECEGFLLETMQPSLWVLYNGSGSTLNYFPIPGFGYSIAIPPDYTYVFVLLDMATTVSGGGNICSGYALFAALQSGRLACPFSDLPLPYVTTSETCFCDASGASVTAGVA